MLSVSNPQRLTSRAHVDLLHPRVYDWGGARLGARRQRSPGACRARAGDAVGALGDGRARVVERVMRLLESCPSMGRRRLHQAVRSMVIRREVFLAKSPLIHKAIILRGYISIKVLMVSMHVTILRIFLIWGKLWLHIMRRVHKKRTHDH
jgi:hypothetical protein